jgi:hypothetical protein
MMSMTQIKLGMIVEFVDKVYEPPFYPYYEEYKGHKFKVDHIHHGDHLALTCITGDVLVKGYVHDFDVRIV